MSFQMTRLPTLWREFDELFRDLAPITNEAERPFTPAADVVETPKAFEIRLDLPGMLPENIDVKVDGSVLTVTAIRNDEKNAEGHSWVRRERAWGKYVRSFTLPNTLDATQPAATYKHGVLMLSLPKREEAQPRSLKVKVEA